MVDAVVSFCVDKLKEQIASEIDLLSGISDDVAWIKDELESMKAFLVDADRRRDRHAGVEAWVTQVRRLVFHVEDAIDEFMIQIDKHDRIKHQSMGFIGFYASYPKRILAQHRFAVEMQSIRVQVKEIHERRGRYRLQSLRSRCFALLDPGAAAPYVEEADIVGQEKDTLKILQLLLNVDENAERAVISIEGTGGLGKTTLAKRAYKDIQIHFEAHAWVFVSQTFQTKEILKNMLKGFFESRKETTPSTVETMAEAELRETILKYLQGKRYALVLDDVWEASVWRDVKDALPRDGNGRIIITTCIANIAYIANEKYHIHHTQPLDGDLAWELFCKKAFKNESPSGACPKHLITVAEALVKRCKGLPQAIVAIGGLMSKNGTNPSDWHEVLQNLDWELSHNQDLAELNSVLLTSYNELPSHLKYCFLYCALFPKHHVIKREKLIRMWVAEGFIEEHARKTLEELANDYFFQLIDRNLLLPVHRVETWRLEECKLHGLMREIAIYMFQKEEFAAIITKHNSHVEEKHRRLAIHSKPTDIPNTSININPRAFLMFSEDKFPCSLLFRMISDFKTLRVLDLQGSGIKSLPNEIDSLIHLRYLNVSWTAIERLPDSLQRLHNLQTLEAWACLFKSFPDGMVKLVQLRHLVAFSLKYVAGYFKLPRGMSNLCNLQTLSRILIDDDLLGELGELKQLRVLKLGGAKESHCRQLCDAISQLKHLRCLRIQAFSAYDEQLQLQSLSQPPRYLEELYLRGFMKEFPGWIGSLSCVCEIRLWQSRLVEDPFPILGQLPNLMLLHLMADVYVGKQMFIVAGGFPKLRWLKMYDMRGLEELSRIEEGTFQSLEVLTIKVCPKLSMLPVGLQHTASMKELKLEDMPEDFVDRIRKGGADHFKVQHIPLITHASVVDENYVIERLS